MRSEAPALEVVEVLLVQADGDGFQRASVDTNGTVGAGGVAHEVHWQHGFFSQPMRQDTSGAAQAAIWYSGSEPHALLLADPRVVPKLFAPRDGDTAIYSQSGAFVRLEGTGNISLFTTSDGTTDGKSIYLRIARPDPALPDDPTKQGGFTFNAPWGVQTFDPMGWRLRCANGARIEVTGMYGLPSPLDQVATTVALQAGTIRLNAAAIVCGAGNGVAPIAVQPLAKAPLVLGVHAALLAWAQASSALGLLVANTPSSPGVPPSANQLVASAIAAEQEALGALAAAVGLAAAEETGIAAAISST